MTGETLPNELILRTKIRIPGVPPGIVARTRLLARLDESAWQRVTLVCAPAGFGKTTLLAAWARRSPQPVAWLTLDSVDNSLPRFLNYLIAAVQAAFPGTDAGAGAVALLAAPQAIQPANVIASLLNDLDALPGGALVLDDAHLLHNPEVQDAIARLVEGLPAGMRLVLASREDPSLPLARLRARGQLSELRGADLRFTLEEATAFLNQAMGLQLSPADVAALEARTEGWIAGLQLAALSMRDRKDAAQFIQAFSGSHRYVLDYLVEEVLHSQSAEVQEFMLRTSLLDRLSAPLCDALLGPQASASRSSQELLEHLEDSNLFIVALDDERCWYRYHTLFADLLRYRLGQALPAELPDLHRRAAAWLRANDLLLEAVQHLLAAGDLPEAGRVIEEGSSLLLAAGQGNRAQGWLDMLPPALFAAYPRLHLIYAFTLISTSQFGRAEAPLQEAERLVLAAHPGGDLPPEARALLNEIKGTRAIVASGAGHLDATIRLSTEALADPGLREAMGASLYIGLGVAYRLTGQSAQAERALRESADLGVATQQFAVALTALCNLGDLYLEMGQLRRADATYRQALETAPGNPVEAMALSGIAEVLYQHNQLAAAAENAGRAVTMAELWGNHDIMLSSTSRQMRIFQAQGQTAAAAEALDRANHLEKTGFVSQHVRGLVVAFETVYWLNAGQLDLAWQRARENPPPDTPSPTGEALALAWAIVAAAWSQAHHDPAAARQAVAVLDVYLPELKASGRTGYRIEMLAVRALAHAALGDESTALADLEESLALAQPEGYLRVYLDLGVPLRRLLRALVERLPPASPHRAYVLTILAAAPDAPALPIPAPLAEPLSEREREVLALAAAGLSNAAIAARLYLAEGTVKRHLHNIFEKLGAASRVEAIAAARRLRLIE